jgi:hypothetical protein
MVPTLLLWAAGQPREAGRGNRQPTARTPRKSTGAISDQSGLTAARARCIILLAMTTSPEHHEAFTTALAEGLLSALVVLLVVIVAVPLR